LKNLIDELNIEKIELSKFYNEAELRKLFLNINTVENFEMAQQIWKAHKSL
jgi:GTP:adenosylcobinamide-phosphate guanylyltransferase